MVESASPKNVVILGSTGSIGRSALDVIGASGGRLQVASLSANNNVELLKRQTVQFRPRSVVVSNLAAASATDWSGLPAGTEILMGADGLEKVVTNADADLVLSAIVGIAGLRATWAALEAGKTVALANKESLVVGGPLITEIAKIRGGRILPVDSEHSAVFQAMQAGRRREVRRVILTASGGPFRNCSRAELSRVTPNEALAHPTWNMGEKITIDSATLMNKALEIIEARWLFDLTPEQIQVVIHPQSMVHSMVEFVDGSVVAQVSPPDMRLPIHYALYWPERCESVAARVDWGVGMEWSFSPPDLDRFDALALGLKVAKDGGTAGAALNGANEASVAAFLAGRLRFDQIVPVCRRVLENHDFDPHPSLERLFATDAWARKEVANWIAS